MHASTGPTWTNINICPVTRLFSVHGLMILPTVPNSLCSIRSHHTNSGMTRSIAAATAPSKYRAALATSVTGGDVGNESTIPMIPSMISKQ